MGGGGCDSRGEWVIYKVKSWIGWGWCIGGEGEDGGLGEWWFGDEVEGGDVVMGGCSLVDGRGWSFG